MPEGPEVKIASSYYNNFFENSKNIKFDLLTEYYEKKYSEVFEILNSHISSHFQPTITIGKNLFIPLTNGLYFNFHLGMTGGWSEENIKHCHFRVRSGSKELFFKDVRKFGKMRILNLEELEKKHVKEFDMLNDDYDFNMHFDYLKKKISPTKSVCSTLMDQRFFPGVGNYIKSEALYASKIHPEKKWGQLSTKKITNLISKTQEIMQSSYASGGAELKDFKNPFHSSDFKLNVYGKKEDPNGLKIISKLTSDQRKSWYCPKLQK